MAYKALYRTYRPQKFSEVIGQDHVVRTLQNAILSKKISHAYLFSGPRGTGKTSVARIFAKALNCEYAPTSEPCGECVSCKEISESNNPDVVEIDAASNNGVDEIRDIRDKVKFLPGGSKYKIYIIDEVHMLTQGAFNALLKTLEEPPQHVIFILATTEPHKVLPTILSRCQRFDFKTLSVKEIASQIRKVAEEEKFKISDEAIIAISEGAEGGMRDALSYLDQAASFTDDEITIDDVNSVTGNLNYDKIIELAHYFEAKNINQALKTINDLVNMGKEISKIVSGMLQFYRDVLLYKNIDTSMFSKYIFEKAEFKTLISNINTNKIFYYVDVLSEVQTKIKATSTPNIYLDVAVIKMINIDQEDLDYRKRIKDIEDKIQNLSSNESLSVDNDKVDSLEQKLARVVNELSRLELHKLDDRIKQLEQNIPSQPIENNDELLKVFDDKINSMNNSFDQIQSEINKLKSSVENLEEESTKVDQNDKDSFNTNFTYDLNQVKDKLNNIESKVYKLISGTLANANEGKKTKEKPSTEQIVLFGDEIVTINDFKKPIKEKYNFEGKQLEVPINDNIDIKDETLQKEEEIVKEKDKEDPIIENEQTVDADEVSNEIVEDQKEVKDVIEKEKSLANKNEHMITLADFEIYDDKQQDKKVHPDFVQQSFDKISVNDLDKPMIEKKVIKTEDAEIVESAHSQLVRKINVEKNENSYKNPASEEIVIKSELPVVEETKEPDYSKAITNDEFSNYSVSIIERILHSSRTSNAREDKGRIINLWKSLTKSVLKEMANIADLLNEGQVVAVGEKEFILTYPNAAMCNQVMKMKFKRDSLKLLYDYLGDTYNYIALPENVWQEKRIEYINQYNIGVRFPKITPINDINLTVETENQEYLNSQEKMVNKAIRLFGESIVKIE